MHEDRLETSRTYACPECGPKVEHERIALYYTEDDASSVYIGETGYQEAVSRRSAHAFVDMLLRDGYIKQMSGPVDKDRMTYTIRSELGVVSPSVVATLEARIAERQGEVAAKVADEAIRLIDHWGSHYGTTTVRKDEAARFVREALKNVTSKPSE